MRQTSSRVFNRALMVAAILYTAAVAAVAAQAAVPPSRGSPVMSGCVCAEVRRTPAHAEHAGESWSASLSAGDATRTNSLVEASWPVRTGSHKGDHPPGALPPVTQMTEVPSPSRLWGIHINATHAVACLGPLSGSHDVVLTVRADRLVTVRHRVAADAIDPPHHHYHDGGGGDGRCLWMDVLLEARPKANAVDDAVRFESTHRVTPT